ncbi:MAG: phosphotransferase [Pseudomonadales bacterium]|nr:phosphotransferase [Pseudomonadales bacterium]
MAKLIPEDLPRAVRLRAASIGSEAEHWIEDLPAIVAELSGRWAFEPGQVMGGGSESLILLVTLHDGTLATLKVGMPGVCDCANEARVLRLAAGTRYVDLYRHDPDTNALLVERLGGCLGDEGKTAREEMQIVCDTMAQCWIPVETAQDLMTGGEKAAWLADFIGERGRLHPGACESSTIERALSFCEERAAAFDPAASVLVHGDGHAHNTLSTLDGTGYRLIDPDGLFAEPACDLATIMRGWNEELLGGDSVALGIARCHDLASRTGASPRAIWQWGFMERVSTGLVLHQIGMTDEARDTLAIADRWQEVSVW